MQRIWRWLSPNLGRSNSTPGRPGQPRGFHPASHPTAFGKPSLGVQRLRRRGYEWMVLYLYSPHATVVCTGGTFTCTLCRHLVARTDEKYLKPRSGRPHWGPKFELGTSRIRSKSQPTDCDVRRYCRIPFVRWHEENEVREPKRVNIT